jgi:hypothetical protein
MMESITKQEWNACQQEIQDAALVQTEPQPTGAEHIHKRNVREKKLQSKKKINAALQLSNAINDSLQGKKGKGKSKEVEEDQQDQDQQDQEEMAGTEEQDEEGGQEVQEEMNE